VLFFEVILGFKVYEEVKECCWSQELREKGVVWAEWYIKEVMMMDKDVYLVETLKNPPTS